MIPGVRTPVAQHPRRSRGRHGVCDVQWALREVHAPRARRGSRRDGLRFEAEVSAELAKVPAPWFYVPGPWISYREESGGKLLHAQPDGLLINFRTGMVVICEMKLRHTGKAERQLVDKYLPLILQLFPPELWKIRMVEIYKFWDFVETGLRRTEVWNLKGWGGEPHCYGWRGVVPAGLRAAGV